MKQVSNTGMTFAIDGSLLKTALKEILRVGDNANSLVYICADEFDVELKAISMHFTAATRITTGDGAIVKTAGEVLITRKQASILAGSISDPDALYTCAVIGDELHVDGGAGHKLYFPQLLTFGKRDEFIKPYRRGIVEGDDVLTLTQAEFKQALKQTLYAVATDTCAREFAKTVNFSAGTLGLTVTATNGHRLAQTLLTGGSWEGVARDFNIYGDVLSFIQPLLKAKSGDIEITLAGDFAGIAFDNWYIRARTYTPAEPIDYARAIPDRSAISATISADICRSTTRRRQREYVSGIKIEPDDNGNIKDTHEGIDIPRTATNSNSFATAKTGAQLLSSVINFCGLLANNGAIEISFESGGLCIRSEVDDVGAVRQYVCAENITGLNGGKASLKVNVKYLLGMLRSISGDEVTLELAPTQNKNGCLLIREGAMTAVAATIIGSVEIQQEEKQVMTLEMTA